MKKQFLLITLFLSVFIISSYSQVTNLTINGEAVSFTMTTGDPIIWSYDVPDVGDTTLVEIWVDIDDNQTLNESVDVLWTFFLQIDGDSEGHNGPPDTDGEANGQVSFEQAVGLAPAKYIMIFKNNNDTKSVIGSVDALTSPTFTISGKVTVPDGYSSQYIMLGLESKGEETGTFWDGLTDADGNFSIEMNSDTSGNPWRLRVDNKALFGASVVSPDEYEFIITPDTTAYNGKDFSVEVASSQFTGMVIDEYGHPVMNSEVYIYSDNSQFNRWTTTDMNGEYHLGLMENELPVTNLNLTCNDTFDTAFVTANYNFEVINSDENIVKDFIIFRTNSTISGTVTFNGSVPGFTMPIWAANTDSGTAATFTDNDGNFSFYVSDKISDYMINLNVPQGYEYNVVTAHPGESNVVINLTITDVPDNSSNIPKEYSLEQNFPNPFNPTTTISYSIPHTGLVQIKIFNIIGKEVTTLVNEQKRAGKYKTEFNADDLPSGVYLYRLQSGDFVQTEKMILLK